LDQGKRLPSEPSQQARADREWRELIEIRVEEAEDGEIVMKPERIRRRIYIDRREE